MLNHSKSNIYYSPSKIKKNLNKSIDFTLQGIQNYCLDPVSNFTRNRKLSARTLIKCIMNFSNHSTLSELSLLFSDMEDMPTPSALCQRRKLLDPEIFKRINRLFLCSFDNYSTINGYRILAQDGSSINIPFRNDDTRITYNQFDIPCCQYHINALYDCLNHIFLDWSIDTATKKQESDALINIIYSGHYPQNAIFTADRGYENYNLFAHFIERNLKFAIRVKDINTKNGIMTNIITPDGTFDITVSRTLTRLQTKEIKANKERYVFVPSTSRFDFLDPTHDDYEMSLRIVRFKTGDGSYETIVTNLSDDEFSLDDFKELYHYRWEEETAFNKVKNTLGMVYFHAVNRKLIQQEINATFLMYNVSEIIVNNIEIKQNRQYSYKANFANAVTNIRLYLRNLMNEKRLVSRIKKFLVPIRPERSYERPIKSKSVKPFNHRTS